MKDFITQLFLPTFLELEGEVKPGMKMVMIDHYPCKLISRRMKWFYYDKDDKSSRVKVMQYKVQITEQYGNKPTFKKNQVVECLESELKVALKVRAI
jgi:hypothetical protein